MRCLGQVHKIVKRESAKGVGKVSRQKRVGKESLSHYIEVYMPMWFPGVFLVHCTISTLFRVHCTISRLLVEKRRLHRREKYIFSPASNHIFLDGGRRQGDDDHELTTPEKQVELTKNAEIVMAKIAGECTMAMPCNSSDILGGSVGDALNTEESAEDLVVLRVTSPHNRKSRPRRTSSRGM